ncbi:8529_t:CDS:2 [Diversispora eburnea]|uniref:8529_t:CDS:1 n=1 Tax=Diversispora eburnea TaxID=1213867 RepID=A0A9N8YQH8_9GLOM|nr:8529_t:CDS:2 [Diversispora eburnea]
MNYNAKFAITIGEAFFTHFAPLFAEVSSLVKEITKAYETAQLNKRTCIALIDRIQAAEAAVNILKRHKKENEEIFRKKEYYDSFQRFITILQSIKTYIQKVTQLTGIRQFISNDSIKENFTFLINEFDSCVANLHLSIFIANEEQRKKDIEILEEDLKEMAKFMESIGGGVTNLLAMGEEQSKQSKQITHMLEYIQVLLKSNPGIQELQPNLINFEDYVDINGKEEKRGKLYKKINKKTLVNVACKPIGTDGIEDKRELAILGKLEKSPYIIKFLGISCGTSEKVLVYEWAEYGSLREFYMKYQIRWNHKLKIAADICRGLVFLHGCEIFHHDIRCANILITENLTPKIANFNASRDYNEKSLKQKNMKQIKNILNWMAPEKMYQHMQKISGNKEFYVPYTVQCEIFSFGMLLWELAFERIPYEGWDTDTIYSHVMKGGRESFHPEPEPNSLQVKFFKIITWKHDPGDRKDLLYIFNKLNDVFNENFANPDDEKMSFEPLLSMQDGITAHKRKEYNKAWKCFNGHSDIGKNYLAIYWKAYYLWEGLGGVECDKVTACELFKKAADNGNPDAQLRYAFALKEMSEKVDSALFMKYLMMAVNGGNTAAQYLIGDIYVNGKLGFEVDKPKGIEYLKLAALKDHLKAKEALNTINLKQ